MKQRKRWKQLTCVALSGLLITGLVSPTLAHASPVKTGETSAKNALKATIQNKNLIQDPDFTSFTNDENTGWVYMSQIGSDKLTNLPLIPNGNGYDIQNDTNDHILANTEHVDINGEPGVQVYNKAAVGTTLAWVQQKITNLIPGQTYHIGADYRLLSSDIPEPPFTGEKPNILGLVLDNAGDQQVVQQEQIDKDDNAWKTYDYSFVASGTEATISFLLYARTIDFSEQTKMTAQYKNVQVINADQTPPDAPTINDLTTDSTSASGTAEPNSDVTLTVDGTVIGTGKADADGNYNIPITPQPANAVVEATATDIAGNISDPASTVVASLNNSAISGTVTNADTGNGFANTNVELHDVNGNLLDTQQTDSNGNYNFTKLPAGDYYVKVVIPSDYEYVTGNGYGSDGNSDYINLNGDNTASNYNITLAKKEQLSTVNWIYNKDTANNRVITDGDNISVFENYTDENNYHNLNFNLKDNDGNILDPRDYTITSSNPSVANIILGNGGAKLYAATIEGPGSSVITIKDKAGNALRQYTINVKASAQDVKWIYNKDASADRIVPNNDNITVSQSYADASGYHNLNFSLLDKRGNTVDPRDYTITSSNPAVATVIYGNSGAQLYAAVIKGTGSTVITVKDSAGQTVRQYTLNITADKVLATDISLSTTNINTTIGGTGKIDATVQPTNTTNKTLSYTPADPSIITVDANGNWTAHKAGTTTIAVKTTDGSNITKPITVNVSESVVVKEENIPNYPNDVITEGKNIYIDTNFTNTYNSHDMNFREYSTSGTLLNSKDFVYTSSNNAVLSPKADNGDNWSRLAINGAGVATITVKDKAGNTVRTFIVHVAQAATTVKATDLSLSASNITANVADTGKINATVSPANTTNKTVSYTAADPSIITVDANGNWVAKKAGTTTITVKTTDGSNLSKTITVTVNKSIADRMKSADVELVNLRPNTGSTGTNAYIYPHSADVPAGVTYTIETYKDTGVLISNITVGVTNGTYHQVLQNTKNPTAAWGVAGQTVKVYATYQGVKYLVTEGPSTNYYSVQTTHVWKD
ncbi:Ig-like domain-containing protein [Listeria booriae]|uniref:Ig-like domain-containing protein n=1 Tax=Listeria booriae TaxID=1552123 RepID=UPI001629EB0B|nr:Ig-like domain-containing protein [Listeria booriae]MBC2067803.1 hypothetical protein [Listeria booriae]